MSIGLKKPINDLSHIKGSWFEAQDIERSRVLNSLLNNPIEFLNTHYAPDEKEKIISVMRLYLSCKID